jgi:signal transduction histidine kinase
MAPNAWLPAGIYSRFVIATSEGSLWFAVRGLGVRRFHQGRWTAYTTAQGLAADTVRDVQAQKDGTLLFATLGGGLSLYQPDTHPPQTYVGSGPAADEKQRGPGSVIRGEGVVLTFSGQDVLKDTPTDDLLFSHRIDGKDWTPFAPDTRAWLTGMAAGEHVFEVRAMDRDLNVDPSPARHIFRVLRPWWSEPWLLIIVGLTLLSLLYAGFRIARAMTRERAAVLQQEVAVNQRRQFVRLASHELRKPLTRLAHRAEMLSLPETLQEREKVIEYSTAIVRDSGHLSRLVETLLQQARLQEGGLQLELQTADLNQVVEQITRSFSADARNETPVMALSQQPLQIRCDPFYLPLAIRNLLDNALKYCGSMDGVVLKTSRRDQMAVIQVKDQGPGISPEDRQRIFEPFFRGKTRPEFGGFGLGLSFARDIARAHGGDLFLEEFQGNGSTFSLSLPLSEE